MDRIQIILGVVALSAAGMCFAGIKMWTAPRRDLSQLPRVVAILLRLIYPLESVIAQWLPARWRMQLQRLILDAGFSEQLRSASLLALQGFSMVLFFAFWWSARPMAWIEWGLASHPLSAGGHASPAAGLPVFWTIVLALCVLFLPLAWLKDRAHARRHQVQKHLPFFLDLLTMMVESGQHLNVALAEAVRKGPEGLLRDAFEQVLRDMRAGRSRAQALQAMTQRLPMPELSNLVSSLTAAERQGSAVAPLLRAQAEQRRMERFLRAEKLAMKAPVKMLFPLVTCIFPCTFIVLFFPLVYRLVEQGWLK